MDDHRHSTDFEGAWFEPGILVLPCAYCDARTRVDLEVLAWEPAAR